MDGITMTGRPGVYDPHRADEVQAFVPGRNESFALPAGITKSQAVGTLCQGLRLMGATEREIAVWRHIADTTEREAWTSQTSVPLNWRRQSDMAREMGLTERQWRNIERSLAGYGVLAISTAENGYRGYRAGSTPHAPLRAGLSLEPALANYEAIVARLAEADEVEAQRQEHILHVRRVRHRLGILISGVADRETHHWAESTLAEIEADLRPEVLRSAPAPVLEALHVALLDFEDRLREAMQPLTQSPSSPSQQLSSATDQTGAEVLLVDNANKQQKISGAPEMGFRCHIQPESNLNESCNDPKASWKLASANADDVVSDELLRRKKDVGLRCGVKPELLEKLTPERVRDLASGDTALYLDGLADWREAIPFILRDLGINISAWLDAVEVMSEPLAFLALIVIDRNRFHPVVPVLSPGGALRAFTRKAQGGELNLTRAIIGIWERERQGKQSKGGVRDGRVQ